MSLAHYIEDRKLTRERVVSGSNHEGHEQHEGGHLGFDPLCNFVSFVVHEVGTLPVNGLAANAPNTRPALTPGLQTLEPIFADSWALELLCVSFAPRVRRCLELSESKNDTCRVAEAILVSVDVAKEAGGQRIRRTEVGTQVINLGGTDCEVATQADVNAPAKGHRERRRAGHAAGYSADDGKANSPAEIRKSLPEQSMTKDGCPTKARRGRWAEQKVVHALIGGDRNSGQQ